MFCDNTFALWDFAIDQEGMKENKIKANGTELQVCLVLITCYIFDMKRIYDKMNSQNAS